IVYRGAGTVAFASGADISEFQEQRKDAESSQRYGEATAAAYAAIRECPKPTVAMIYGFCMGGAMGIAMGCDLRFAAEGSKYGIPAAKLSIVYPPEAIGQLVDLVGPAYAKDILFSARTVGDREALAIGLIQRLGHAARLRPITTRTGFHTFDRWRYNRAVVSDPPDADVVIGVDLDGYRWASRRPPGVGYAVMLKGIIADELRNEGGLVRALLTVQARWERVNVRLAERVIVPSRYSAGVAHEVYDVPRERLAVVPEPIDLAEWRRRFAEAMAAGLPIVACRTAAVPEVVEDGRTGLLVSPNDPEELARAMERVLANAEVRAELGAAGRRRVEDFDLDRVAARLLETLPS